METLFNENIIFISLILENGMPKMPDENAGETYTAKVKELKMNAGYKKCSYDMNVYRLSREFIEKVTVAAKQITEDTDKKAIGQIIQGLFSVKK